MNLKEKLSKLDRSHTSNILQNQTNKTDLSNLLPGEILETEKGVCWLNRKKYDLNHKHGSSTIGELLHNQSNNLQLVTKNVEYNSIPLDKLIFVDTETTGLSGGIGTVAFLIGIGYFDQNHFIIDQLFMRGFNEELPVLNTFLDSLSITNESNGAVVSFNGKSYDLSLLMNRSIFHRFFRTCPQYLHIDLLHPSRRFWKNSLPDCTLGTLESNVLRVERHGDVPGYLIPEMYFHYLRTKDPRPLSSVFYHNQMDILSLVSILHTMLQIYFHKENISQISVDWLAVGSSYNEVEKIEDGLEFYHKILTFALSSKEKKETLLQIAKLYKKIKNYILAIQYWHEALNLPGFSIEPYIELAKVYEHRIGDFEQAKKYTSKALENAQMIKQLDRGKINPEDKQDLLWRLHRLERKMKDMTI